MLTRPLTSNRTGRARIHALCIVAAAVVFMSACSTPEPAPSLTTTSSEIFEEPTVCSAAQLSGACRGPWVYRPYATPCYLDKLDAACPQVPGQCHPSCLHAEAGATESKSKTVTCIRCTRQFLETPQCANSTSAYLNTVVGTAAPVTSSFTVTNVRQTDRDSFSGTCNMTLTNARTGVDNACLPTFDCMVTGSCRLPSHGNAPPGECGTSTTLWSASSSGLSRGQLSAEQIAGLVADSCSTLEDHALGAARLDLTMARTSATNPFWQLAPVPATQADAARHELVKQAKLMYELGTTSSNVSAETLRALYTSAPADELSCGVSASAPVSVGCRAWGTSHGLDGPLGLCQRMLSSHIAPSVLQAETDRCLDLLTRPALAETDACAAEYRNAIGVLEEILLGKSFAAMQKPPGSTSITGLDTALARIDRWYTGAAVAFAGDPATLSDATGRMLKSFWTRVYDAGSPVPSFALGESGSEAARTQLSDLVSARIEADRQVLAAVFAAVRPLDEVPVLLIVGDAFTSLHDRLRTAAPLYDLACRIKGACSTAEANEATQLLRLIGAIGDTDTALGDAVTAATAVRTPWITLFTSLRTRRGVLETALRKATGRSDATLAELYVPNPHIAVAGLAERVAASFAMWTSYAAHGVLLSRDDTMLRTALVNPKVDSALQAFVDDRAALTGQRTEFQRVRGDFAKTVVDRINTQQFQDRINNEVTAAMTDYTNLGNDLHGLMRSQDLADQQISGFLASYIARASGPGWLPDFPIAGHPGFLSIAATEARGSTAAVKFAVDVPGVAVHEPSNPEPWHLDVASGDMLTFDVNGAWSPTCALRFSTVAAPGGDREFVDPTHLLVGSEGFSMSFQNEKFVAQDHQTEDFSSSTASLSICASISAGGPIAGALGASVSAEACQQWSSGHKEADTSSSGDRSQYSANFAGGMRLPGTPFPMLPGGALLLVEVVERAGGQIIRDAHVVRSKASYLFPQAARIYLVANDRTGCGAAVDTGALSVSYVHGQSAATAARALVESMAAILTSLQTSKAAYVNQGSVSAAELAALKTGAYDQLRASCHCNLSAFPDEVRGMLDAWLDAELASIERATRVVAAERGLDNLVLRLKALQEDLAGSASSSRLLALLTYWQLGQLAFPQLRSTAEALLDDANGKMMPMLRILYPQALVALRQSATVEINGLRTFDWMLPYDEQANLLENLTVAMKQRIQNARDAGGQSVAPLVIVFPKPGTTGNVPASLIAPADRLTAVWGPCASGTGTCLRQRPTFTITPEDVYGRALVGLGCGEAAPIIQTFALISVNNSGTGNTNWNDNPRRADIFRAADMLFPTENGILSYRTDGVSGVLAPPRVRVLAAADTGVGATFNQYIRAVTTSDLQGVSPFGSFTVDLGESVGTAAPLTGSTAIVAYFDLQTRAATGPLAGLGVCTDAPPISTPPPPPGTSIAAGPSQVSAQ